MKFKLGSTAHLYIGGHLRPGGVFRWNYQPPGYQIIRVWRVYPFTLVMAQQ